MVIPRKLSDPQQYTIGLVTALSIELAAVLVMLDQTHAEPHRFRKNEADENEYTWGEINSHNVVVASMPKGEYGLVSAAQTASCLLSSLPHIRFGLMVGIGAGIPREGFDIRLGDIVVSQPTGTSPGVVQYDLGKVQEGGHFQRVGSLNRPPRSLLNSLSKLSAGEIIQGPKTPEILAKVLEFNPRLTEKDANGHSYVYPGALNDRLFEPSTTHVPQPRGQPACTLCDTEKEITRERRSSSNPVVHYGTVASGNSVVKDGISRDRILRDRDLDTNCICFEMEAAGLINTFSCLVIRGICDYADSHKNDRWQKYAAIAAAAFAKEVLQAMDPIVMKRALEMDETINEQHRNWLDPIDPSNSYNDALAHRQALTGQWFLESEAYSDWKRSGSSALWLHEKSGSGKTTLASTVIENLKKPQVSSGVVLYFYFSFVDGRQQSLDGAIRALAYQLSCQNSVAQDDLRTSYDCHKNGLYRPSTESIRDVFRIMVEHTGDTWIVLDALDECKAREDEGGLLSWLESLVLLHGNLHLFVTSRPDHDIMDSLQQYVNHQILLSNQLITNDIRTYVHAEVGSLKRWASKLDVQNLIEEHLMEKADGVFRWASCQMEVLKRCPDRIALNEQLASLPETLEETYAAALRNIPKGYSKRIIRLLQFLVFSERRLLLSEAVDILATTPNDKLRFDPENRMPVPAEISHFCSSLLVIEGAQHIQSAMIQLAHSSVKEYLASRQLQPDFANFFEERLARASMATVCLAYLLELKSTTAFRETMPSCTRETSGKIARMIDISVLWAFKTERPLAQYAAEHWVKHALKAGINEAETNHSGINTIRHLIAEFLECQGTYELCYGLHHGNERRIHKLPRSFDEDFRSFTKTFGFKGKGTEKDDNMVPVPSILRYVIVEGLTLAVKPLLEKDASIVNQQAASSFSAMNAAAESGHKDIVRLLLKYDATVDSFDLKHISSTGDSDLLGLMLKSIANPTVDTYGSALDTAAEKGYTKIVKILVNAAVAVNQAHTGQSHPSQASNAESEGRERPFANILRKHVMKSGIEAVFRQPLVFASKNGFIEIVRLLLDNGANVDRTSLSASAIFAAAKHGHEDVVALFLERGANASIGSISKSENLLSVAYRRAHPKIVQTILDKVTCDNDSFYRNSMIVACAQGHEKLVGMIMPKLRGDSSLCYHESLVEAAGAGHYQVVRMLIERGAAVNGDFRSDKTPLGAATASNRTEIATWLLRRDADPRGWYLGKSALHIASGQGNEELVQELLRRDANPDTPDATRENALSCAARNGHENIVRMLLDAGADINKGVGPYGCAFDAAHINHHENIVRMIGEKGVSTRSTFYKFWVGKLSTNKTNRSQSA